MALQGKGAAISKKHNFLISITILLLLFSIIVACSSPSGQGTDPDTAPSESESNEREEIATEGVQEIDEEEARVSYLDKSISVSKASFADNSFTFDYPSNWNIIDDDAIDYLFDTSLSGGSRSDFDYLGGVYVGDLWKEDIGEASFTIYVIDDPSFTAEVTDDRYQAVKNSYENQFGERLLGLEKTEFNGYEAFDIKTIGNSRMTQSRQIYIMTEGKVCVLTFMSRIELYEDYWVILADILDSFNIQE